MITRLLFTVLVWCVGGHFGGAYAFSDQFRFSRGGSFTTEVSDQNLVCFHQKVDDPERYKLEWRVVQGGLTDIDISLEAPGGKMILIQQKSTHGRYSFDTREGVYTLCFSNEFSRFTHKKVYFSLTPEKVPSLTEEIGATPKPLPKTLLEGSFDRLHDLGSEIASGQLDLRNKATAGFSVANHLNHCVQLWSMGLVIFILITGFGEVIVLRLFFTETSSTDYSLTEYVDPSGVPGL